MRLAVLLALCVSATGLIGQARISPKPGGAPKDPAVVEARAIGATRRTASATGRGLPVRVLSVPPPT